MNVSEFVTFEIFGAISAFASDHVAFSRPLFLLVPMICYLYCPSPVTDRFLKGYH